MAPRTMPTAPTTAVQATPIGRIAAAPAADVALETADPLRQVIRFDLHSREERY